MRELGLIIGATLLILGGIGFFGAIGSTAVYIVWGMWDENLTFHAWRAASVTALIAGLGMMLLGCLLGAIIKDVKNETR